MPEPTTLYKLMILYMLNKVEFPLTNSQMLSFFLDNGYTDYFTFQQCINEMLQNTLIQCETVKNSTLYTLTDSGEETLSFFQDNISNSIIEEMDAFLKQNHVKLRNESGITANYYKNEEDYIVRCQIKEKKNLLFALEISVPTKDQAIAVANNWTKANEEIYNTVIMHLFK